jgi:DNA-binding response OmpR family regulator
MSNILYLGNTHTAEWIRPMIEANGGYLYTASTLYETLAITVMYSPDLVILDAGLLPEITAETQMQLLTIDVEPIVIYDEEQLVNALHEKMTPAAMPVA